MGHRRPSRKRRGENITNCPLIDKANAFRAQFKDGDNEVATSAFSRLSIAPPNAQVTRKSFTPFREDDLDSARPSNPKLEYGVPIELGRYNNDVWRTVAIVDLAKKFTLPRVLSHIKQGNVYSCHLDPTNPVYTAIIVFVEERSAKAFLRYGKTKKFEVNFEGARAMELVNPTYPIPLRFEGKKLTRCLRVSSGLGWYVQAIFDLIHDSPHHLICRVDTGVSSDQVFQFASVRAAYWFYRKLITLDPESFDGGVVTFADDPCAALATSEWPLLESRLDDHGPRVALSMSEWPPLGR
ncbi:hypothetical protein N7520_008370 [Penicillium odoratum]|uniref:uncharacterized protein n=1 Tax=Penicillium odoratum TaxID=1167516 RepID=UPI002547B201|nr:uncharacterized protein N7520_008370 [Penicillium odoratum]KAJ5761214.1 hypothetical protein N7520_008370 [Penicillium odoratum]